MNKKPLKALFIIAAGVAVLGAGIYWLNVDRTPTPSPSPPPRGDGGLEEFRASARRLQNDGKWAEAQKKWETVLSQLPATSDYEPMRVEAERNRQTCIDWLRPEKPPVAGKQIPPPEQKPTPVPKDKLIAAYPQGRKVRSICYLFIDGKGQNDEWVFRGSASFHYQQRVVVETTVKENRGTAVVFVQHFLDVDDLRAVSDRDLEFHWPESPILSEVWDQLDDELQQVPAYRVVKIAGKVFDALDPNGKCTLTRLQRFIPGLPDESHLEVVERVRQLSGQRLELEYVSGLGVVFIKVLDGQQLDPDLLDQVARGSTLLADYFLGKAAQDEREQVSLDAKDVGDLFCLAEEGRVTGRIRLQRIANQPPAAKLAIEGGELDVELDELGSKRHVLVEPIKGTLFYSTGDLLIEQADATWRVNGRLESTDHLLFGTTNVVDLKLRTYCESQLISPGGKEAP